MAPPPLCIAILVVNETSSDVTIPPTRRGPCSTSARSWPMSEAISKLHGFGRPVRPRNKAKIPKKVLLRALVALNRSGRGVDEISWIPAFPVRVRKRLEKAECADPVSLSEIASRTAENASPRKRFSLHWHGPLAPGSSARRPMPHTGSRGMASAASLFPVLKMFFSRLDSALIWCRCQIPRHFSSPQPQERSQSCAHLNRCTYVCVGQATT